MELTLIFIGGSVIVPYGVLSRWLDEDGGLRKIEKGVFLGFSEGVRACVGRTFAEVEIVAVLGGLMRGWRVVPGRNGEEGVRRALEGSVATLTLNAAQGGAVRLVRRE